MGEAAETEFESRQLGEGKTDTTERAPEPSRDASQGGLVSGPKGLVQD